MRSESDLRKKLQSIDHKGYPAYKELHGSYDFSEYILSIDHVQGDPFASPSSLSVHVPQRLAGFPAELWDQYEKRITLQDQLTRLFEKAVAPYNFKAKGSGKSGLLATSHCGQQVLERTACRITSQGEVILRLEAGFPANGRSINGGELLKMLCNFLPDAVSKSLYWKKLDQNRIREAIQLCQDQQYIRQQLPELGLCAFLANGSILPRESGVSQRPMKDAIPLQSPESLEVTLRLPNRGEVKGMGIPTGITLFAGGGYHGKSTILQALEMGVYNHIAGDGRELVITDSTAVKLRAEDGRSISNVDISPFINRLPNKKDTVHFTTEDASGSTSQAANLIEGLESGTRLLLIDEDTSATNFMIRDELMQKVICQEEEPITPFIQRVEGLSQAGISTVLVVGSSGSYFHIAHTIIQMKEYVPYDITQRAKAAADAFPGVSSIEGAFPLPQAARCPRPNAALRREQRLKTKTMGTNELLLAKDSIELRYLEQLADSEQTAALAQLLKTAQLQMMDGKKSMTQLADLLEKQLQDQGLESLFSGEARLGLARPRRQELLGCFNRYRKLYF